LFGFGRGAAVFFFSRKAVARSVFSRRRENDAFARGERGERVDQTDQTRLFLRGATQTGERQRARLERGGGIFPFVRR
jgi:hypothetical protein